MNALDIARAAAMEVGLDPALLRPSPSGTVRSIGTVSHPRRAEYLRAMWLAIYAVRGPDYLIRCPECSPTRYGDLPGCTPVREALIGRTCGRTIAVAPCAAHRRSQ